MLSELHQSHRASDLKRGRGSSGGASAEADSTPTHKSAAVAGTASYGVRADLQMMSAGKRKGGGGRSDASAVTTPPHQQHARPELAGSGDLDDDDGDNDVDDDAVAFVGTSPASAAAPPPRKRAKSTAVTEPISESEDEDTAEHGINPAPTPQLLALPDQPAAKTAAPEPVLEQQQSSGADDDAIEATATDASNNSQQPGPSTQTLPILQLADIASALGAIAVSQDGWSTRRAARSAALARLRLVLVTYDGCGGQLPRMAARMQAMSQDES